MKLTKQELDSIQEECKHYENNCSAVIEALKIIQKHRGWVSDESIVLVAQILGLSISDVEGVATFYNQIFRCPVGKHIIRYCDSVVCYISGCENIQKSLERILNIKIGYTTKDGKFTLLPTCCLGMCYKAPVVMIDENTYYCVVPEDIEQLLELY